MVTANDTRLKGVSYLEVDIAQAGQRVDNFLIRQLKGVPRSHIYRILRNGEVRVNKGRVKPTYRVVQGDRVRIPPMRYTDAQETASFVPGRVGKRLSTAILHEDDDLIILNKPSGLAAHGGSGLQYGVIEALRQTRPPAVTLELVHRLDRATSGCLVIAKKRAVLTALHQLLREGKIEKRYLALVAGRWQGGTRAVSAALARGERGARGSLVTISEDGKSAETLFIPRKHFADCSLMDVRMGTGRTHQIRVHAAHVAHPLAGDDKYGDYVFNRKMRKRGLKRLFLHASHLRFQMPGSDRHYRIDAPMHPSLVQVLDKLEQA